MSRLVYASHTRLPSPDDAPIHSATTAPMTESGAATSGAAEGKRRADGQLAGRQYGRGGASTARNQAATAGSTDRKPPRELISTGKNVSSAVTATVGAGPNPGHTVRSG